MKIEGLFILKAFADHNSNLAQIIGLTIIELKSVSLKEKLITRISSYLYSVLKSPHCVVNGKINASVIIVFVTCKILSIWSHPLKAHLFQYYCYS